MNAIVTPIRPQPGIDAASAMSALKQLLGSHVAPAPRGARDHRPLFTACQIGTSGALEDAETLAASANRDVLLVEYRNGAPAPLSCHYGLRVWWATIWHLHLRPFVPQGGEVAVLIPSDSRTPLHFALDDEGRVEAWARAPFESEAEREAGCQRADRLASRLLGRG